MHRAETRRQRETRRKIVLRNTSRKRQARERDTGGTDRVAPVEDDEELLEARAARADVAHRRGAHAQAVHGEPPQARAVRGDDVRAELVVEAADVQLAAE